MLFHWSCREDQDANVHPEQKFSLSNLSCFSEDDSKRVKSLETSLGPIVQDPKLFIVSLLLTMTQCGAGAEATNPFCLTHLQLSFYLQRHLTAEAANSKDHVLDVFERIEELALFEPYLATIEEFTADATKVVSNNLILFRPL